MAAAVAAATPFVLPFPLAITLKLQRDRERVSAELLRGRVGWSAGNLEASEVVDVDDEGDGSLAARRGGIRL